MIDTGAAAQPDTENLTMKRLDAFLTLAVIAVASQALAKAPPEPALRAHYTFDEGPGGKVRDRSGHGNDGINHGAQ